MLICSSTWNNRQTQGGEQLWRGTLNKLGIRDLVGTNDDWQEWKFEQLVEVLQKWTAMKPLKPDEDPNHKEPPSWKLPWFKPTPKFPKPQDRMFNLRQEEWKTSLTMHVLWIERLWQDSGHGTMGKVPPWEKIVFQLHWYKVLGCELSYC